MQMPTYAGVTAYDPNRDVFWFLGAYSFPPLYRYDPAGNGQWTEHGAAAVPIDIDGGGVVDPVHDLFIYVDARGSGKMFAFDLKNPDATSVELVCGGTTYAASAEIPAGTCDIRASFADGPMTPAGRVTIAAGGTSTVQCIASFQRCKAK